MNSETEPLRLRMFVDDVTGIGFWPDWDDGLDEDAFEAQLPITQDLRDRIRDWVDDYTRSIEVGPGWSSERVHSHDRAGYHLSRELQAQLGTGYVVVYGFTTDQVRRELG